jgi:hypothetical protein
MDPGSVNYTVKELLGMLEKTLTEQIDRIGDRIEEVNRKLDLRASAVSVAALETRVANVEADIVTFKIAAAGPQAVSQYQRAILTGVWLLVCSAMGSLIYLVVAGVHP